MKAVGLSPYSQEEGCGPSGRGDWGKRSAQ